MKNDNTRELVELSLYATLIIVSVQFIRRIPFGPQFVHLGNALVVIAVLIFGSRKGALVATVALGLFDIFNGYAAEVWITILESLIVCLVLYLIFEKLLKSNDKIANVIIAGVIAAVTKIILNFLKYTIINTIVASLSLKAAMLASVVKIGGTFGTSVVTIIAVPLLYPVFKRILKKD
ncbi:ECF transporter S component [Streptococcus thermophilus]|uniref:ECF transporter S component n=1 Tax=Streptococcus thermophilus TaxID=1308 RepID=UPI003A813967